MSSPPPSRRPSSSPELGHHIDYTHLPYDGGQFIQDFLLLWANGAANFAGRVARATGRAPDETLMEPFSLGLVEMAHKAGPPARGAALQRLEANALAYDTWFPAHQFDVVLSPVLSSGPPLLGEIGPRVPFDTLIGRLIEYVGYTPIHNLAGAPAMSVPLCWTQAGLPIGTMFAARAGNERTLSRTWPTSSKPPNPGPTASPRPTSRRRVAHEKGRRIAPPPDL